jgi:predicted DNA binding CopG/RHH family protein
MQTDKKGNHNMKKIKVKDNSQVWDTRELGASPEHVAVAATRHEQALDKSLELQSISIRLPIALIEQYKLIAHFQGVGYQPLMREVLTQFVPGALQEIMQAQMDKALKAKTKPLVRNKHRALA